MARAMQGSKLQRALYNSDEHLPVLFIDDDPSLTGQQLGRLKVYDADSSIKSYAEKTYR